MMIGFSSRRVVISSIVLSSITPSLVASEDGNGVSPKKPFAPIETLLPAVRVKLMVDRSIQLTKSLRLQDSNTNNDQSYNMRQLEQLLLEPQNYVKSLKLQGVPAKPGDLYLNSYQPMKGDLPLQRTLIQNGDVQTWRELKKTEKKQERSSEIRAALNAYTDALSFSSDKYLLNVDKATKKSMVREDRLPDVKQVITSDMGMRYLYRNQVLTAMDDVKAEMKYQRDSPTKEWTDLLDLLQTAEEAMQRWLSLIDASDVKDAFNIVLKE